MSLLLKRPYFLRLSRIAPAHRITIVVGSGVIFEKVQEDTSFEIRKAKSLTDTKPPTGTELRILREHVDPNRYVIVR